MIEKKTFNWIAFWLLGSVTCGIYPIYVFYKMTAINNDIAEKYGEKKIMGYIPAMLLGIITCGIFIYIWMYQFMDLQVRVAKKSGVKTSPSDSPIVLFLLSFVPIYSFYVVCDNFNSTVEAN